MLLLKGDHDVSENPYQSPGANVEAHEIEQIYAGFWIRFVASIIDSVFLAILILVALYLTYGGEYFAMQQMESMGILNVFFSYFLPIIIVLVFWIYRSATPGKMILNIKIVDAKTGANLTPGQSVLRYIGYYISAIFFGFGFIWAAFDARKQAWHDKIAGTVCIIKT